MAKRLTGKVAIVTGGGDGIGHGIVRRLASEGASACWWGSSILRPARVPPRRPPANSAPRSPSTKVDVTDREQAEAMVAQAQSRFGSVDILVNNAWGGGNIKRIEHKTDTDIQHGVTMGLYSAMWAMRAAFPLMKTQGWGWIVNLCSLNGVNAHIGSAEYNVGKEALRAYSRTAAARVGALRHHLQHRLPGLDQRLLPRLPRRQPGNRAAHGSG